ncbi:MAG: hypothetical protein AAF170_14655 [Bacteroidota bacterium]
MPIPDHDGRPIRQLELAEAFRRIDADRRLYLVDGDRRVLRAAAAWDNGSEVGVHRELGMAVAEIARRLGMTDAEVCRLLVSTRAYLVDGARRRFRDG